ncbi:MAG: hypothetical protein WBO14_14505 [Gammaproteobacteria bacterium]
MSIKNSIRNICAGIVFTSGSVNAVTIVDTGPGPSVGGGPIVIPAGYFGSLTPNGQSLAAEFSIVTSAVVTGIEGWMVSFDGSGQGTIALYSDGGDVPGNELFATTFLGPEELDYSWAGASGLSWDVSAGTYWVSFEARLGQTLAVAMPGPSPNPLLNEAFTSTDTGDWIGNDGYDLGVRISAVPIPAAVWLFSFGLIGLIGYASHKKA